MKTIQTEIPENLYQGAVALVKEVVRYRRINIKQNLEDLAQAISL